VFAFLLAKKRLICFKLDDAEDDEDEEEEEKEVLVLARVLGDAKQTLPDILVVFLFIIVEKVFRRKEKKKNEQRQHTNANRVPPTCPLPLPRRRRRRLYRSGFARTTSWRSVT
jgi:hypothetical protein